MRWWLCCSLLLLSISANAAEGVKLRPQPNSRTIRDIAGWQVQVDDRLLQEPNTAIGAKAMRYLESKLMDIEVVLPKERVQRLKQIKIVLDLDCGDLRAMQYHPSAGWLKGNGYSADLEKCVHIPFAKEVYTSRNTREQPWAILHELAHAYHDQVLSFDHAEVKELYARYKASGHGDATLLHNGRRVKHYALTDHKEFFAEMTESYFGSNDFYPFNRAELLESEPEIEKLLTRIWMP